MKELFEDFKISNCANGFFDISLKEDGSLEYKIYSRETESNRVYLEHKETGITFEFESDGDEKDLTDYNSIWLSYKRDIDAFKKVYANFIM